MIHEIITSCDHNLLIRAFVTYVRLLLEYASRIWSPVDLQDIAKLESVQKKFTKRLFALKTICYQNMLVTLNVESLWLRRLQLDLNVLQNNV